MAITKAAILVDVNANLQTNYSGTQLDVQIQKVLDDLSEEDLLVDSDATQSLVSGDETLDEPTGFRALVSITLTVTSSGLAQSPLFVLKGGHKQYRDLKASSSSGGIPEWCSNFDSKFWLWPPPSEAMTALIEYYKNHPQDVNNIEFGDNFKNVIYAGVTFYTALKLSRTKAIEIWGALYENAKSKRINSTAHQPHIVKG